MRRPSWLPAGTYRPRNTRRRDSRSAHPCLVVGAADQCRGLPLLRDEARVDQPLEMMGQRRRCETEFLLDAAHRQTFVTGANQGPIKLKSRRVAERFELAMPLFRVSSKYARRQLRTASSEFRRLWKFKPLTCVDEGPPPSPARPVSKPPAPGQSTRQEAQLQ